MHQFVEEEGHWTRLRAYVVVHCTFYILHNIANSLQPKVSIVNITVLLYYYAKYFFCIRIRKLYDLQSFVRDKGTIELLFFSSLVRRLSLLVG